MNKITITLNLRKVKRFLRISIVALTITAWVFSGWPPIFKSPELPPQPKKAQAAVPAGVIVAWPNASTTIPAGWYRDVALDGYFPKMVTTAVEEPGSTGGGATHIHTTTAHDHTQDAHNHGATNTAVGNGSTACDGTPADRLVDYAHTHPIAASDNATADNDTDASDTAAGSGLPPYREMLWIYSNGATDIPDTAIAFFDTASLPTSWNATTTGLFYRSAAASTDPNTSTQGSDTHTHTSSHNHTQQAHNHTTPATATAQTTATWDQNTANPPYSTTAHTHGLTWVEATATNQAADGNIQAASSWPSHYGLVAAQNETDSSGLPGNTIALWRGAIGDIPDNWYIADGNNGTPNLLDKFVNATSTANLDKTGGSDGHDHTATAHDHTQDAHYHGLTVNASASAGGKGGGSGGTCSDTTTHSHTGTVSANATANNQTATLTVNTNADTRPPFYEVAYIMYKPAPATLTLSIDNGDPTSLGTVNSGTPVTATTRLKVDTNNAAGYLIVAGRNNLVNSDTLFSAYGSLTIDDSGIPTHTTACDTPLSWAAASTGLGFTVYDANGGGKNTSCWGSSSTETGANLYASLAASASATTILNESDNSPNPSYVSIGYKLDVTAAQTATAYNDGQVVFTATTN